MKDVHTMLLHFYAKTVEPKLGVKPKKRKENRTKTKNQNVKLILKRKLKR